MKRHPRRASSATSTRSSSSRRVRRKSPGHHERVTGRRQARSLKPCNRAFCLSATDFYRDKGERVTGGRPTLCEIPTILQPHRIPISKYWQNAKIFVALHLRNSTRSLIINSRPLIASEEGVSFRHSLFLWKRICAGVRGKSEEFAR